MAQWWSEGIYRNVVTTQGKELQVLYAGRPSPGVGPDFRDALLVTKEGEFIRGDVEVHVRQSDWQGHGHHTDSQYNRVALHLFLKGKEGETWLENGTQAQDVLLSPSLHASRSSSNPPISPDSRGFVVAAPLEGLRALSSKEIERALDEAGERRFLGKASAMLNRLQREAGEEVLYCGLMESLGYSRNRRPMCLLAKSVPLRHLREVIGRKPERFALESLLLGSGGLLPHQRALHLWGDEERRRSEELLDVWNSLGQSQMVATDMWERSGLRPQNSPVRRLVGASYLLERHWSGGLVDGMRSVLMKGNTGDVEKTLEVKGEGFWARHLAFQRPVPGAPSLVGKSRARDMAINVLLPFFFARAYLLGEREVRRNLWEMYCAFPASQDNEITREIKCLLATSKVGRLVVNSARRQQGLMHMYHILQGRARCWDGYSEMQ